MRTLAVSNFVFPLLDDDADRLLHEGVIYECGDPAHGHDYHLNPEYDDNREDGDREVLWQSEAVLEAIGRAHAEWENIRTLPVTAYQMSATVPLASRETMDDEAWEKRKSYYTRNLSLNVANGATQKGFFDTTETVEENGDTTITVTATLIHPEKRGSFAAVSRLYVISLLDALPGVSEQRKEDAIDLIKMLV